MTRRCNMCREIKPLEDFYRKQWQCKLCNSARNKATYRQKRAELVALLGGRCSCCDEGEIVFLQIDHVNGGGAAERKATNHSIHALYRRVHSSPNDFQLLCGNCHTAKSVGVVCPHQAKVGELPWQVAKI
jgi:hypothetical protein